MSEKHLAFAASPEVFFLDIPFIEHSHRTTTTRDTLKFLTGEQPCHFYRAATEQNNRGKHYLAKGNRLIKVDLVFLIRLFAQNHS
jgi:hypothetical protein